MGKRNYLGSTAAADICGCGFNTPLELYQTLTGMIPEKPGSDEMVAGLYLEDGLREMFEHKTGSKVKIGKDVQHWIHPQYPFIQGTDDGMIDEENGIEIKLVGLWQQKEFGRELDKVPAKYLLQCQHNMMTGRRKRFTVAAFFVATMEMKMFPVDHDAELCDDLLKHELSFWTNHVDKRIAPAEKDQQIVREYLHRKYKWNDPETMIVATPELEKMAYILAAVRHDLKRLDAEKEEIQNALRKVIGNDCGIYFSDNESYVSWNKSKDSKKTEWKLAFDALRRLASPDMNSRIEKIIEDSTSPVLGTRRFLVKGPIFEGDPVVADMRATAIKAEQAKGKENGKAQAT